MTGCLPLHDPPRLAPEWGQVIWAGMATPPSSGRAGLLLAALWLLGALGVLAWLARRIFWRGAGDGTGAGVGVDREDLALLRTARQAVGFLLAKRLRQFKVVRLADWLRSRGRG